MGGNALKQFGMKTRRVDKVEYESICLEIISVIANDCPEVAPIRTYHSKETFGDADILYTAVEPFTVEYIKEKFNPTHVYKNGDVISFDYCNFQIDMIFAPYEEFWYAYGYFGDNDISGNLVGKIAHKFGLKHGHNGLTLPLRDGDNIFDTIVVNLDFEQTLRLLDLDVKTWKEGFDTLEDGFNWVSKSRYFDPDAYKLENLNHIAKVRDKKRVTYNAFLTYCDNWSKNNVRNERVKFAKDKTAYLPWIFNCFPSTNFTPGAEERFNSSMEKLALVKLAGTKFNGNIVSEITGLTGKELGQFMAFVKVNKQLSPHFVIAKSTESIKNMVEYEYGIFVKNKNGITQ